MISNVSDVDGDGGGVSCVRGVGSGDVEFVRGFGFEIEGFAWCERDEACGGIDGEEARAVARFDGVGEWITGGIKIFAGVAVGEIKDGGAGGGIFFDGSGSIV